MRRIRAWGPVIATGVTVVAVATVVTWHPWTRTAQAEGAAEFTRHVDAVQSAASEPNWMRPGSGLFGLVPDRNCLLGFGGAESPTGATPAFWTDPGGGCDRLKIAPEGPTAQVETAGSDSTDTTPVAGTMLPNGTFVGVASERDENDEFSSSGLVFDRDATGVRHTLARLDPPENAGLPFRQRTGHVNFHAVTAGSDGALFVGGSQSVPATRNSGQPRLWRSTDGGKTLTPVNLPGAAAYGGYLTTIAGKGRKMIAAGSGARLTGGHGQHLLVWTSRDGGRTWRQATGNQPAILFANAALPTDDGWLVATSTDQYGAPLILRSRDGQHWTAVTLPATPGGGDVVGLAVDAGTGTVYAAGWTGKILGTAIHGPGTCATVWTATNDDQTWRATSLGCDIAVPVAETTLPSGAIVIASNADLWVRQPA